MGSSSPSGPNLLARLWPEEPYWSWVVGRVLAEAFYGGAEAHEVLRAVERVRPGDAGSWHDAFRDLGDQVARLGEDAAGRGHAATACSHFLRAVGYYRWCEFFLAPEDGRRAGAFAGAVACFEAALHPERVEVPFPGYWLHPHPGPGPAAIYLEGMDVLKEELYFLGGRALLERGVNLLVFDGPGQGEALRYQGIHLRPDAEHAVGQAVDWLMARPEVDPARVGLCGRSFGGYLAGRALAHEPRLRAGVIFGALYDAGEIFDVAPPLRTQFQWILGAAGEAEARRLLDAYTLAGQLGSVRCPTLVMHGEDDALVPVAHALRTYEELGGPREKRIFPSGTPGSDHCQYTGFPEAVSGWTDWLAEQLRGG